MDAQPCAAGLSRPAAFWHAVPDRRYSYPRCQQARRWILAECVTLADADLRAELSAKHPDCLARIEARRAFMREGLGVDVKPNILPLSSTPLYLPPFWLKPDHVLVRD